MPTFEYSGLDEAGNDAPGEISAPSFDMAKAALEESGMTLFYLEQKKDNALKGDILGRFKQIGSEPVVQFSRKFATMIGSNVSPIKSLEALTAQEHNPKFQVVLREVSSDVQAGLELHEAFAKHPEAFDRFYIALIRAGEASGSLEKSLAELASRMEKRARMRKQVKSATTYPKVILGISFIIVSFIMIFIIPKFAKIFVDTAKSFGDPAHPLNASLPAPTAMALNASHLLYPAGVKNAGWLLQVGGRFIGLFILIMVVRIGLRRLRRNPSFAARWDRMKIRLPMKIGELIQMIAMADLTRTLATLLRAGLPIEMALELSAETAGNALVAEAVRNAREQVLLGGTISSSFAASPIFPPMITSMIQTGEETGKLDVLLARIAEYYEEETEMRIKAITSLIEPLLIVTIACVIGGLVIVTYLPMFKIYSLLNQAAAT